MSWGKWIIVAFILFAGFIAALVTVCIRQDISLVSKDYYKEELAYQDQIVRMSNTSQLGQKPKIGIYNNFLQVDFNPSHRIEKGELKLFRPSDPKMDKVFTLRSCTSVQVFPINNLKKGMYRAKLQWTMSGKEFYLEKVIYI